MSTYLVGDVHGCFDQLKQLLQQVDFNPNNDTLWLTGDLIARGPKSLQTLRYIYELGDAAKMVLGNHELHLLAVALGIKKNSTYNKTDAIINAPDHHLLIEWLRHQPLLAEHDEFVVCHAGISPQWDLATARSAASEVEKVLQSEQWCDFIPYMHGDRPNLWSEQLHGIERYRYIINAFTRMRYCFPDGSLDMACKKPPHQLPLSTSLQAWFSLPSRTAINKTIVFGHWAALEGYKGTSVIGLDTGCVWGGTLTMLRWEDKCYFTQARTDSNSH